MKKDTEEEKLVWVTKEWMEGVTLRLAVLKAYEEAHGRVNASLHHTPGEPCQCPYCSKDTNALIIHAAEQELKWMVEREKVERLEMEVEELKKKLPSSKPKGEVHCCPQCGMEFVSETGFLDHIETHIKG